MSKANESGQGFTTWQKGLREELAAQGWLGPRMVADPTGVDPDRMVDFSQSRRLKTIFWGNMSSARAAGQWERAQRTKAAMPFLLYVRTTSTDPRPEHLGWIGIILPVDDPFWATHFPPNGWLCHCSVRQVSRREKETLLATKRSDGVYYTDTAPPVVMRDWRNRRTGEISRIPDGIDPGWHSNPGRDRTKTLLDNLELRLGEAPEQASTRSLADLWSDPFVKIAPKVDGKTWLPAGVNSKLADELGGAKSAVVSIEAGDVAARIAKHRMTAEDFGVLPEILAGGTVLVDPRGDPAVRSVLAKVGKSWWRAFVRRSAKGYLRVTSLHQRDEAAALSELRRSGK